MKFSEIPKIVNDLKTKMTSKIVVWNNPYLAFEYHAEVDLTSGGVFYKRNFAKKWNYKESPYDFDECFFLSPKKRLNAFLPWVKIIESWESVKPGEFSIDGYRWSIKLFGDEYREIGGTNQAPKNFDEFISAMELLMQKPFTCGISGEERVKCSK